MKTPWVSYVTRHNLIHMSPECHQCSRKNSADWTSRKYFSGSGNLCNRFLEGLFESSPPHCRGQENHYPVAKCGFKELKKAPKVSYFGPLKPYIFWKPMMSAIQIRSKIQIQRQIQRQRLIKGEAETPMVWYILEKVMTKGFWIWHAAGSGRV